MTAADNGPGPLPDEPPPATSSTLFLTQYVIHWQHGDGGEVVLYLTPVAELDGALVVTPPGQIGIRMPAGFFETFQADVARGGHSSPIAVPRQLGQRWRGDGK